MTSRDCPSDGELARLRDEASSDSDCARHVAACPQCQARLQALEVTDAVVGRAAKAILAAEDCPPSDAPKAKSAPETAFVDAYEIEGEVERGGQGVVYRAMHKASRRTVAIKVVRVPSARNRARLEREARLAARLRHPNIVTLHDCGEMAGARFALAMEWVEGRPFDRWAESVRSEIGVAASRRRDRILRAFLRLCDAVEHAHRKGVIHRDLKPTNILVDADDQPRVLDFGVAIDADSPLASRVTMTGEVACTIGYAAPEQIAGDPSGAVDTRSDVYSLGVLLFEALTGTRPHDGPGGMIELAERLRRDDPAPPSSRVAPGEGLGRAINRDLDTIVITALAREPDRRYASPAALRDDIARLLGGEAIDARRDSLAYVARMLVRRHRLGIAITSVVAIAIVVAASAFAWALVTAREARIRGEAERERLQGEASRSAAVTNLLEQLLPQGDPTPMDPFSNATFQRLNAVSDNLGRGLFSGDPLAVVATRLAIADVSADRGGLRRAEVEYRQALGAVRDLDGGQSVLVARVLMKTAALLARRSSTAEAMAMIEEAIPLLGRLLGPDDPLTLEAEIVRAEILVAGGDTEAALRSLDALAPRLSESDAAMTARERLVRLNALGSQASPETRSATAEALVRAAFMAYTDLDLHLIEALERYGEAGIEPLRSTTAALAAELRHTPASGVAPATLERLRAVKEEILGPRHPDLVETESELGRRLAGEQRFDEAVVAFDRAVSLATLEGEARTIADLDLLYERLRARTHTTTAQTSPQWALEGLSQLAAANRRLLGANHPLHLVTRIRELARQCALVGQVDEARALGVEAIELAGRLGPEGPHLGWTLVEVAYVDVLVGDSERAVERCQRGIELLTSADPSWTFHRSMAYQRMANAKCWLGRKDEALADSAEAKRLILRADIPAEDRAAMLEILDRERRMIEGDSCPERIS